MIEGIAKLKTALVLVAGLLADLLAQGVIPDPVAGYVTHGLAIITATVTVLVNLPGLLAVLDRTPGAHAE